MTKNFFCLFLVGVVFCQCTGFSRDDYSVCTSGVLENTGYYSLLVNGVSYWSHCGFPNPRFNYVLCGRIPRPDADYWTCDPDNFLSTGDLSELDSTLNVLQLKTPSQCTTLQNEKMNFVLLVVIVDNIQVPDLSISTDVCINTCFEIKPTLIPGTEATEEENDVALQSFAEGLIDNWAGMFCNNTLVSVYWTKQNKMATATGPLASSRLTSAQIARVHTKALELIAKDSYVDGFQFLIIEYARILIGFSPAYVFFTTFLVLCLLVSILLVTAFGFTSSGLGGYWDEGKAKQGVKTVLKTVCGVWLIEGLFKGLVRLEGKVRFWWALVPLMGFVACLLVALTVEFTIASSNSTLTSS